MKKVFAFLLLLVPSYLLSQSLSPEDAFQKFSKYPQENVFIQFDKGEYLAGEHMHFKAYVFNKSKLSRISTNLYFECLDKDKKIIYKALYPLATGLAAGSFAIPKSLPENVYYFRAYTSWMLNFDERYQFIQPLAIYNPASKTKLVEPSVSWSASAHVEGGTLLDNLMSKVVVRLHNLGRLPKQWSGYVFEGKDTTKELISFTSLNEEVGSFSLAPTYGKQYNIKITDGSGNTQVISLPPVATEGIALQTANLPRSIGYRITSKGISLQGYKVLAHTQDSLLYTAIIKGGVVAEGLIPVDITTKGLVHLTLFDPQGEVAAERLCFANPHKTMALAPQIEFARSTSGNKDWNQWNISIDTLYPDSYTVSVLDAAVPVCDETHSLFHTFWLSELSVPPYKVNGYFNNQNSNAANALDALLVTEKWELFDWKKIMSKPTPDLKYFPDNYLSYQGHVERNGKPVAKQDVSVVLLLKDGSRILIDALTDSLGNFRTKNLVFRDTAKVFFHLKSEKSFRNSININFTRAEHFTPYKASLPKSPFTVAERQKNDTTPHRVKEYLATLQKAEAEDKRYKTLESVVVKARMKSLKDKLNKELSSPMFRDMSETVFDFINEEQDIPVEGVLSWLNGRVAGAVYNAPNLYIRNKPAQIYIDEFLDYDGSRLGSISPSEIAMVKVIKNAYAIGGGGPVVAVYLKKIDVVSKPVVPLPEISSKTLIGYPVVEKLAAPNYADPKVDTSLRDSRSVLYWNPLFDPENGKAQIQFYNNDTSKKLRLIVVGFTSEGLPLYLNKEIVL